MKQVQLSADKSKYTIFALIVAYNLSNNSSYVTYNGCGQGRKGYVDVNT